MFQFRPATQGDAAIIALHSYRMFWDMAIANGEQPDEAALKASLINFLPWVRDELAQDRYLGRFAFSADTVVAGAGMWLMPWPPGPLSPQLAGRARLMNVYTEPAYRRQGLARRLVVELLAEAQLRGYNVVTLNASAEARLLYEALGFQNGGEMMLIMPTVDGV
jgi:GNAT superfamily N-acetyltransferase